MSRNALEAQIVEHLNNAKWLDAQADRAREACDMRDVFRLEHEADRERATARRLQVKFAKMT